MSTETKTKEKKDEKQSGTFALANTEANDLQKALAEDPELQKLYTEDLRDGMEDVVPRLPQFKIMRESAQFEDPEGEMVKELVGVIIDSHLSFAYWDDKDNNMPVCYSYDGKEPDESVQKPIHSKCISCPMNQWGSAEEGKGKGKACKNMRRMALIVEGESFPSRLTLPPTSLVSYDEYASRLRTKNLPPNAVVTKISLEKKTTPEGYKVSIAIFSAERVLTPQEYLALRKFKEIVHERRNEEIVEEEYSKDAEGMAGQDVDPEAYEGADEEAPF